MDKNNALKLAAVIFGIVALLHLLRAVLGWDLRIAGWHVPVYFSYLGFAVAGFLSLWMFKKSK
ncbi:hypothetical protein J4458_02840 [Candidatus Woesearchaeota archaeon]|nr:hypothetical protein [Candidatus Woesearchaeota archaeon]